MQPSRYIPIGGRDMSRETITGWRAPNNKEYIICIAHGQMAKGGAKFPVPDGKLLVTYTEVTEFLNIGDCCKWLNTCICEDRVVKHLKCVGEAGGNKGQTWEARPNTGISDDYRVYTEAWPGRCNCPGHRMLGEHLHAAILTQNGCSA